MAKVLVADSDPQSLEALAAAIAAGGHSMDVCDTAQTALVALAASEFDLLVCEADSQNPPIHTLLAQVRSQRPQTAVVVTTAFGSVDDAVRAMREGAADLLRKPFRPEQARVTIDRAIERAMLVRENADLRHALDDRVQVDNLIGEDPQMQLIFKTVRAVADTRTTVLMTGESGTGKTVVARALHAMSSRKNGPFVEVHCGAMPETLLESELFGHVRGAFTGAIRDKPGKFETAHGGTIFLDEIGTSSPAFQVRLLRVLQDRVLERIGDNKTIEIDCRIVLATNVDLDEAVRMGRFREDLYYRINVVSIEMPPLRQRLEDIPSLAMNFLRRFAKEHGKRAERFSPAALGALRSARWPGNVRQLENVIERAVIFAPSPVIELRDLPPSVADAAAAAAASASMLPTVGPEDPITLRAAMDVAEKNCLEKTLARCNGNRERAAKVLGINRSTLFAKLRRHGVR